MTLTHMMPFIIRIKKTMGNKHYLVLVVALVLAILLLSGCSGNKAHADILSANSAVPQPIGAESGSVDQTTGVRGNNMQPLSSTPTPYSQPPASSVPVSPTQQPASSVPEPPVQSPASKVNAISPVPAGSPSNLLNVSAGASGMYNFYCFNGYIYQIVSDDNARILVYDKSELTDQPIGNVYNPLYPSSKGDDAYGVNGISNAAGTSVPQSIAVEFINSVVPAPDYYYQRADYFASDITVYSGQTYQIAPVSIVGILTSETESPYAVAKKIGETTDGYDVYSYKNLQSPGEVAVDIPGMTCDLGDIKLYPMAIPIGSIRQSYSAMSFLNDKTGWLCETTLSPPNNAGPSPLSARLLKTVDGGKSWAPVWSAPSSATAFIQLDFINDKTGWAIEAEGSGTACSLMETADGGKNWRKQLSGNPFLSSLQFFDVNSGYVMQGNNLLKTTDGGNTWTDITPMANFTTSGGYDNGMGTPYVYFIDVDKGWAAVNLNGTAVVYMTTDSGDNWSKLWSITGDQNNGLSGYCFGINFCNAFNGWILLSRQDWTSGYLYRTTDGGKSFQKINDFISSGRPTPVKLYFTDENNGWIPTVHGAGGFVNGLMHTADGGKTFCNIFISPDEYGECDCDDVVFVSSNMGFAFSGDYNYGSYIAGTSDGGKTWNLLR